MILIIILYALFASTFTISKAALSYSTPLFLVAVRFVLASIILMTYCAATRRLVAISQRDYFLFAQLAFCTFYLSFTTDVAALQYISSANACLIYNLSPFITALFAYFLYREKLSSKQTVALVVGFLGYLPLLQTMGDTGGSQGFHGELLMLCAVASSCYGWLIVKQLVVERGYHPLFINGVGILAASVLASAHAFMFEGIPSITFTGGAQPEMLVRAVNALVGPRYLDWGMFCIYTILLVIIAHIICYVLYAYLLRRYSATFMALAGSLTPLFAGLFGWFFLHEHISTSFFITLGITCIAIGIFYYDELKTMPEAERAK